VFRDGAAGKGSTYDLYQYLNGSWQKVVSQTPTGIPVVSSALGGIEAVGDFFVKLGQANTWIRVGEVLAGVILVTVGAHAMLKTSSTYRSTYHTAKKLVK